MTTSDNQRILALSARIDSGERLKFLPFWGHTPKRPGAIDASCLSQWFDSPFELDGRKFHTAEHFMMHSKAMLFGDASTAARILEDAQPAVAKKLGRDVQPFDEQAWDAARFDIVRRGNLAKFAQHAPLREFLLATGDLILVEASPTDRVWGIGLAASDPGLQVPSAWQGLNLLGFALMEARTALRDAPPSRVT